MVQWPLPDGVKRLIIALAPSIAITALYEFLVRRVNGLRFLFGMKPLPKTAVRHTLNKPLGSAQL